MLLGLISVASFIELTQSLSLVNRQPANSSEISLRDAGTSETGTDLAHVLKGCSGIECVQRYVDFDDHKFKWRHAGSKKDKHGNSIHTLAMTSQAWMVHETVGEKKEGWTHTITVVVPKGLKNSSVEAGWATLIIDSTGGEFLATEYAKRTGAIGVYLSDVPQEHLGIKGDSRGTDLDEESLKVMSWVEYARHPDHPEWPIEVPDAKSTVRAMDAVEEYMMSSLPVSKWVLTGASKRASATYHTAAVDSRVKAIIPIEMGANRKAEMEDVIHNFGGVVEGAIEYDNDGANDVAGVYTENGRRVDKVADPIYFLDKLKIPKLILMNGNDAYFTVDVARHFFKNFTGPKTFYMYGNNRFHNVYSGLAKTTDYVDVADAFINGLIVNRSTPEVHWDIDYENGKITARPLGKEQPIAVNVWSARTLGGFQRDFRHSFWTKTALKDVKGKGVFEASAKPRNPLDPHWEAFYIEMKFEAPRKGAANWKMSTEACVFPDTYPFKNLKIKPHNAHLW